MTVANGRAKGHKELHTSSLLSCVALVAVSVAFLLWCKLKLRDPAHFYRKQAVYVNGTATVWDGDSLAVQGQKIRLFAVDAPELLQTCINKGGRSYDCGEAAAAALQALVRGAAVSCEVVRTDRYQRTVARCVRLPALFRRGVDLGEWMLEHGHAVVYRQYAGRYEGRYAGLEAAARKARRGVWAGSFTLPWDWRRGLG